MPNVTFNGNTYSCVTAYKGPDYVHLVDSDGTLVVAFDGVTDFSGFSITNGNWSVTPDKNCHLAIFGEGGAILRGKTVDSAIVGTYTHSTDGLTGSGENGKFKATASGTISTIKVNGKTCSVKCGEESSMDLVAGCWYTFILDGNTVNFSSGGVGGGGLNFKVVGNPQPASPSENTIWLNTDVPISGWVFSVENPFIHTSEIYTEEGATTSKYYLNSSGVETGGSATWIITDKILLPNGTISVEITAGSTSTTSVCHCFYDADGNLISGVARKTGTHVYEVPAGAKSIRASLIDGEDTKSIKANYLMADKGAVWFLTGKSSHVGFNASKKNVIEVYPQSAKQFIDGALVDVTAKSYQNGAWIDWWNGELFVDGNTWDAITGGWVGDPNLIIESRGYRHAGTITEEALVLSISSTDKHTNITTANAIDLTNFSYLTFTVTNWGNSGTGMAFFYKDGASSATATVSINHNGDYTLAVPAGSGMYRIAFGISSSGSTRGFRVTEARLMA